MLLNRSLLLEPLMALRCPQMVTMHNYNLVSITIVFAFMLIELTVSKTVIMVMTFNFPSQ